jgi:hypothetical protein
MTRIGRRSPWHTTLVGALLALAALAPARQAAAAKARL